jgi:hypothetical protein
MPIPSIFINATLTSIPGMKTLDDFLGKNWFQDFPALSNATPYAGYYFGQDVADITNNSFNLENPATVVGSLDNSSGYISVNVNNYIDTNEKASLNLTIGGVLRRPSTPTASLWFIGDFSGLGSAGVGFSVGINSNGRLCVAGQNAGTSTTPIASVAFPSSIAVGDIAAFTAYIHSAGITIAVYNPDTQQYDSGVASLGGVRTAGTENILIGRKRDNNATTLSCDVGSVVLIDGELSQAELIAVQQYLLNKE